MGQCRTPDFCSTQGFADIAQIALGNMGWAYYKLGDTEKARRCFIEAGKQAEKLGDVTDQVEWLTDLGYIYMDAGVRSREQSFQQSFNSLGKINSREDIINSLIALAFVSEQTGKLDDAKRYADEALAKAREDKNGRDQVYPLLVQGRVAARLHDTSDRGECIPRSRAISRLSSFFEVGGGAFAGPAL